MSELDIIRAWKDKTYRDSLSADELAQLPEHPAGAIELTNDELANVDGGVAVSLVCTPATPTLTVISVLSVVTTLISAASYISYQYGTGGTAAGCCPPPPPPAM